jgi:hypothetical protein
MELRTETVELRGDTPETKRVIVVTEANWPVDIKLSQMEKAAQEETLEDPQRQFYHVVIYPKLCACSTGDVPPEEEAYLMPSVEHDKWYGAANRMNPHWFVPLEEAAKQLTADALKKKETKRTKSTKD